MTELEIQWDRIQKAKRLIVTDLRAELIKRHKRERGFSVQNLGFLISDPGNESLETKNLIKAVFDDWERATASVVQGRSESVMPQVAKEAPPEYKTSQEWQTEALKLRTENAVLRAAVHVLTDPSAPLNSVSTERILLELGKLSRIQTRDRKTGESGQKSGS